MSSSTNTKIQIGKKFLDLAHPERYTFNLEEIVNALNKICRFNGHTSIFYSVLQHSILCAEICPKKYKKQALLHDASEAFIGDVSSPLKKLLPEYKIIEQNVQRAICEQFNIDYPFHKEIHLADRYALKIEREALLPKTRNNKIWAEYEKDLKIKSEKEKERINKVFSKILCLDLIGEEKQKFFDIFNSC